MSYTRVGTWLIIAIISKMSSPFLLFSINFY